jgi:FAD:protein FMN transferase
LVNAGGDLRIAGRDARSISLRHPLDPARIAHRIDLRNAALATSAAYFSTATPSALIDGHSGIPFSGGYSVSVGAALCANADALTKVALFASPLNLERCLVDYDAKLYVLGREGPAVA